MCERRGGNCAGARIVVLTMELILLAVALFAALLLIPVGLPGTWLMLAAGVAFKLLVPLGHIGWLAIGVAGLLVVVGEVLDVVLMSKYAAKYGGSKRAAWGAIIGGLVGAFVGVPVPVLGSIVGAFAGAFIGALVMEATVHGDHQRAARAAWGAVLGRAVAAGAKVILGCVVAAILMVAALA